MKMKSSTFEVFATNVQFVDGYLKGSHLTAFSGYNLFARKSGLYVKLQTRNRRNCEIIKTVSVNFDWKILEIASKPWIKSQLDKAIKEVDVIKSNRHAKKAA